MSHLLIGMTPNRDILIDWLLAYRGKNDIKDVIAMYDRFRQDDNGYGMLLI